MTSEDVGAGPTFDEIALEALYAEISAPQGVGIAELLQRLAHLFSLERSPEGLQAFREGKKPWKKLIDEVVPVVRFLEAEGLTGNVRFPLDDQPPDAWVQEAGNAAPTGIEVTRVLARSRVEAARDLRDGPMGRGFVGLQDSLPQKTFDEARARGRITNGRQGIAAEIEASAVERLNGKSDPKYAGQTLLLLCPLGSAPNHDWAAMCDRLALEAETTAFSKVVLIDEIRAGGAMLAVLDRGPTEPA